MTERKGIRAKKKKGEAWRAGHKKVTAAYYSLARGRAGEQVRACRRRKESKGLDLEGDDAAGKKKSKKKRPRKKCRDCQGLSVSSGKNVYKLPMNLRETPIGDSATEVLNSPAYLQR